MRYCKATCVFALLGASRAVMFGVPELHCDPILPAFQGCLRGQHCSRHGFCEPPIRGPVPVNRTEEIPDKNVSSRAPASTESSTAVPTASTDDKPILPYIDSDKVTVLGSNSNGTQGKVSTSKFGPLIRVDGLCGASHDGALCPHDECCSPYGVSITSCNVATTRLITISQTVLWNNPVSLRCWMPIRSMQVWQASR